MMKVGDIGVLQNIIKCPRLNGTPAEIIELHPKPGRIFTDDNGYIGEFDYLIKDIEGDMGGIFKHQIRPLRDPDQHQTTLQEETVNE